jgi:ATP-binding cassette, subfamily B, bacterial
MTASDTITAPEMRLSTMVSTARGMLTLLNAGVPGIVRWQACCACLDAVATVSIPYFSKRLIDSVEVARRDGTLCFAVAWLLAELALALVRALAQRGTEHGRHLLEVKGTLFLKQQVLEKACSVPYTRRESPSFASSLARASEDASIHAVEYSAHLFKIGGAAIVFFGCLMLLLTQSLWVLPVLVFAAFPAFVFETASAREAFRLENAHVDRNRKGRHLENVLTTEHNAKDIWALGAGGWLLSLYESIHAPFREGQVRLARGYLVRGGAAQLLGVFALYGPYLYVVVDAIRGGATIGGMLLFLVAFQQGAAALIQLLSALATAFTKGFYMRSLLRFLGEDEAAPEPQVGEEPMLQAAPELVLEDVWFTYPGASQPVLRGLNLRVRAGETLALVGPNGNGKSTLVKLLLGLYRVDRGRILLGGVDVASRSAAWRRKNIGVVFQDFVRFHFSVRENVGIGWLPHVEDDTRVRRALDMADASRIVDARSGGLRSTLGSAFGGDDLSGGQWQRIALARLFMRPSRLWILDEPTAAMDPETEEKTFSRFHDWSVGRTAIIISHRFSTVRIADRIAVIADGKVSEIGSHDELIATDGRYSRFVALQHH